MTTSPTFQMLVPMSRPMLCKSRETAGVLTPLPRKPHTVVKRRFYYDHGTAAAMENRGVVASWDHRAHRLTIWDTTQAPVFVRNGMAAMLGLSENQVRVIAPFIGGGFGPKIMMFYPEEVLVSWATTAAATTHEVDRRSQRKLCGDYPGAGSDSLGGDGIGC